MKWEYKQLEWSLFKDKIPLIKWLNEEVEKDWELVQILPGHNYVLIFKRPLEE